MNEGRGMKAGMDGCREERTEQKRLNVNERVKCRGVKGPFLFIFRRCRPGWWLGCD